MVDDLTSDPPRPLHSAGKRRRTPASVASSNAHLQFLNTRQNRWLNGWTNAAPPTSTTNDSRADGASPLSEISAPRGVQEPETADSPAQGSIVTSAAGLQVPPNATSSIAQERADTSLQEQERSNTVGIASVEGAMHASSNLPPEAGQSGMPAPTTNSRKSMDSAATARTLPSPAPSDENTNSPTFGEGQIPARRGPSSSTWTPTQPQMSVARPSASNMPEQLMYTGFPQQNQAQQSAGVRPQQVRCPAVLSVQDFTDQCFVDA
jgi:hypothetical protein